jgi:tetratricopeptide (TPR) repeat protein
LSMVSLYRGAFADAQQHCATARLKYKNDPTPLMMATVIEFFTRRYPEAEKLCREAMESNRTGSVEFVGSVRYLSLLGFILRNSGAEPEGTQLLEEVRSLDEKELSLAPENPGQLYGLAASQAALGESERAIATLNKAIAAGWTDYRPIELDPRFDSIRSSKAFQEILDRVKNKVQTMRERVTTFER